MTQKTPGRAMKKPLACPLHPQISGYRGTVISVPPSAICLQAGTSPRVRPHLPRAAQMPRPEAPRGSPRPLMSSDPLR
jgi:hypothetical protein